MFYLEDISMPCFQRFSCFFMIKPPGIVLFFEDAVVALVSTRTNRLKVCVINRHLLPSDLSLIAYQRRGLLFCIILS